MVRRLIFSILFLCLLKVVAPAQDAPVEIEVKKAKIDALEKGSLRFLRENRDFLRAQLDRLRQVRRQMDGGALELSARDLLLRELMAGIEADEDSLARERALVARRDLFQSVSELGELESQLDRLEALLGGQMGRLDQIEADYAGRQRTALLILVQNFPQQNGPERIILEDEDSMRWEVTLSAEQREALRAGGAAQILHEFVEPRQLRFSIRFAGGGYDARPAEAVDVDPARDRINLLSIDLARLDPGSEAVLPVSHFQR
jgi:hypothetical protein